MTSIVSNFKVNMDKFIEELNSDGKFELSRAEQEMVKEQTYLYGEICCWFVIGLISR